MLSVQIGKYVASLRKKRGWSQAELAERANVSRSFVSSLESGGIHDPGINKVAKILALFERTLVVEMEDSPPTLEDLLEENSGVGSSD